MKFLKVWWKQDGNYGFTKTGVLGALKLLLNLAWKLNNEITASCAVYDTIRVYIGKENVQNSACVGYQIRKKKMINDYIYGYAWQWDILDHGQGLKNTAPWNKKV